MIPSARGEARQEPATGRRHRGTFSRDARPEPSVPVSLAAHGGDLAGGDCGGDCGGDYGGDPAIDIATYPSHAHRVRRRLLPVVAVVLGCARSTVALPRPDASSAASDATEARADVGPEDSGLRADTGVTADASSGPCAKDPDCAPTGWCRPTGKGARECVPWVAEGRRCGGFVPAHLRERCNPSLLCLEANPILEDAPGRCVLSATVRELVHDPERYAHRLVGIDAAYVLVGTAICTRVACPPNVCCNQCTSQPVAADELASAATLALSRADGEPHRCSGTECDWMNSCSIGPDTYRLIGKFEAAIPPHLEVESAHRFR